MFVLFVAFVIVVVYLGKRARRNSDQEEQMIELRSLSRPPLRSLSSPKSPPSSSSTTPTKKKSNVFHLPTKQCNLQRNNAPPPATKQFVQLQRVINPSPSVNEFVAEPEVYPVSVGRPKRVKPEPEPAFLEDEKLLKKEKMQLDCCDGVPGEETCTDLTPTVSLSTTIEVEIETGAADPTKAEEEEEDKVRRSPPPLSEKPARSCLSSVSDSSQGKPRRGLSVTFAESPTPPKESEAATGEMEKEREEDEAISFPPPPPLPPRGTQDEPVLTDDEPVFTTPEGIITR